MRAANEKRHAVDDPGMTRPRDPDFAALIDPATEPQGDDDAN